ASPDDLRALFASLPPTGEQDWFFCELVPRPEMPADLLFDLLRQQRFVTDIGHLPGPRELLEELLTMHDDFSEAVLTLLYLHYSKEDVPASDFERLLREHWDMDIVRKWTREDHDFPPDKVEVLKRVVADSPPPRSPAWLYPPPESGEGQG